jgi:BMFP domain-containing protein YqiC
MANNDRIPDPAEAAKNLFGSILKEGKTLADEVSGNAKAVAKSALGNLDVVSRDEFDAQKAVLLRTRARVEQLEAEIETLLTKLDELEKNK